MVDMCELDEVFDSQKGGKRMTIDKDWMTTEGWQPVRRREFGTRKIMPISSSQMLLNYEIERDGIRKKLDAGISTATKTRRVLSRLHQLEEFLIPALQMRMGMRS